MKEINENAKTVVSVNTETRDRLNKLRKEISKKTKVNISTDNLINILLNGYDDQKIRSVINVY